MTQDISLKRLFDPKQKEALDLIDRINNQMYSKMINEHLGEIQFNPVMPSKSGKSILKETKKKCYFIMVAKAFQGKHPRVGEPTEFKEKIFNLDKLHTMRGNYPLWEKRIREINEGKAYLSVRQWKGRPYNSGHDILFELEEVGIQKTKFSGNNWLIYDDEIAVSEMLLAHNDGLTLYDFQAWFEPYPKEPLAMIHFTDFRY